MKHFHAAPAFAVALAAAFSGCRSYHPATIDWNAESAAWFSASTNQITLSRESVRALALIGNPEISTLRLKCAASTNALAQTGWWEDPEISFDGIRVLADASLLLGSALTFTLPVSGVAGLEKRVAQAYSEADAWTLRAAESMAMAEAETLFVRLRFAEERLREPFTPVLENRLAVLQTLAAAGELAEVSHFHETRRRLAEARVERKKLQAARTLAEMELLAFLGLPPGTRVETTPPAKPVPPSAGGEFARKNSPPAEGGTGFAGGVVLTRHPRVMAKLARLDISEAELRLEIRRQYPDVELGVLFGREEGANRAGLTLGVSLPLWNRNRAAIAHAESERAMSREDALQEWKTLVHEYAVAEWGLRHALEILELAEENLVVAREVARNAEALFDAGEAGVIDTLDAEEHFFAATADLLDAMEAYEEALIHLNLYQSNHMQSYAELHREPRRK